jgi:2-(1,2-epoxy-1,2-dihydrophenyl)acetyl-CoA isomerase
MTTSVQRHGRVLRCVISAADRGSTLDGEAMLQAAAVMRDPGPDTGAILLVGDGASFCTGGNVGAFAAAGDGGSSGGDVGALVKAMAGEFHGFVRAMTGCPVPVLAAVHGWAAGAGMSIVCLADITVAGASARFRPAYPGIGFSPDGGMSWTLPRLVGAARARHILLTNQVLDAAQALALGLIAVVVPDDQLAAEAGKLAGRVADGPTAALGRIKRLIRDGESRDLDRSLDAEAVEIAASAAGAEGREGVRAFREKRPARFHGEQGS